MTDASVLAHTTRQPTRLKVPLVLEDLAAHPAVLLPEALAEQCATELLASATYQGTAGDDWLIGGDGNDIIDALAGDDTLDGGLGIDTLIGGTGNDLYYVDHPYDVVVEGLDEGTDTVVSTASYFTLAENVENLILASGTEGFGNDGGNRIEGNRSANRLYGRAGDDVLMGAEGNDRLDGEDGNDTLMGGTGNDTMNGGAGDDTYHVDSLSDRLNEIVNGGTDTVVTEISFTLGALFENIQLVGGARTAVGNGLGNLMIGNDLGNRFDGLGGNDTMIGGAGDDGYWIQDVGDTVVEAQNEGVDTVFARIGYALEAHSNIENLTLHPFSGNLSAAGNELDNRIEGNIGDNVLTGGDGADTLIGNAGLDQFHLEKWTDGADLITDFVQGEDKIVLSGFELEPLRVGYNLIIDFWPMAVRPMLLYSTETSTLSFDPDGMGPTIARAIAVIGTKPLITQSDFTVI